MILYTLHRTTQFTDFHAIVQLCSFFSLPAIAKYPLEPSHEPLLKLRKVQHNLSEEFVRYLFGIYQSTVLGNVHCCNHVMAGRHHSIKRIHHSDGYVK